MMVRLGFISSFPLRGMAWIKIQKTRAYFNRFYVQFRRRRDGLTDYQQRRALTVQDKDKYLTPKYRFVVRRSNKFVTCQIISSCIGGDHVHCAAYSSELPEYGLKAGLNNYAACYCTGLLCARRMAAKLGLKYEGNKDVGKLVPVQDNEDRAAFKCFLDIGLARTTTGANIFACLKGAIDGGLNIPHSGKRFINGYANDKVDSKLLADRIYGNHVSNYMSELKSGDEEEYKRHFSQFIKNGITSDNYKSILESTHQAIRKNPIIKREAKPSYHYDTKKLPKQSLEQRKENLKQKKIALINSLK